MTLDLYGFPGAYGNTDVQIFNTPSTVDNLQWLTWRKPRGKSMCMFFLLAGGGGGGGGFTAAAGNARGGGGSGGSSAVTRFVCPAMFLPDVLTIQVGAGGQGVGSGGGTAGSGVNSFVLISGLSDANASGNCLLSACAVLPTGGGTGTGAAVGAAGGAGTISAVGSQNHYAGLGVFLSVAGIAGVAGGAIAGANGTAQVINTASVPMWGATSGAGTTSADFAGGAFTQQNSSYISQQRPATPAAGSNDGSGGFTLWKPFFSFGGGGGSASNAGVGGNGGNGGYGAGGGGGGGGTTGGRGGDGGTGLVIIICW